MPALGATFSVAGAAVMKMRIELVALCGATLALFQRDKAMALENAIEFWLTGLYEKVALTCGPDLLWSSPKESWSLPSLSATLAAKS